MPKKVFMSFRYDDLAWKNDAEALFKAQPGQVLATPVYLPASAVGGRRPDAEIEAEIRGLLEGCAGLIVVVGNDGHNSPWLKHELGLANALKKPKVAMRHPQATGGLPNSHSGMRVIEWSSDALAREIQSW